MLKLSKIFLILSLFTILIILSVSLKKILFIYWLVLLGWAFFVWKFKIKSQISFWLFFILLVISSVIATFLSNYFGEIILRFNFIILIIGFVQILIEFKKLR